MTNKHVVSVAEASSPRLQVVGVQPGKHRTVLTCMVVGSTEFDLIELYDKWREVYVKKGDIVRVLRTNESGAFVAWSETRPGYPQRGVTRVDASCNLLVLHPDILLAGSMISDSFQCLRKSVIQFRNPEASGPLSLSAFYGIAIHELFHQMIVLLYENPDIDVF